MKRATHELALQALIAGLYVAITFVFQGVSFMAEQLRLAEFLLILVLLHHKNMVGILLGTLLANTLSPIGVLDIVVGSFATYAVMWLMVRVEIKWLKYMAPAIGNGVIIGIMLAFVYGLPVFYAMGSVYLSEMIVTFVPWVLIGDKILKNKTIQGIFG